MAAIPGILVGVMYRKSLRDNILTGRARGTESAIHALTTMSAPTQPSREILVPVLDLAAGPPDPVAVATWHMALSNLVGAEVPHQILALWVYPGRGGVVLLGPDGLAEDHLAVPEPDPFLSQDQLFDLEETLRRAKYASAAAIPIRAEARDVGVLVIGTFEPGAYGPDAARMLHRLAGQLAPSIATLGDLLAAPSTPTEPGAAEEDLSAALIAMANDAPTGPELVRRLSGLIHPQLPHDRLEIVAFANGSRAAMPLSGQSGRRRWGSASNTWGDVAKLLLEFMATGPTAAIANLGAEAPGLTFPGGTGGPARTGSVLGARLRLGDETIGLVVLGHAVQSLYRDQDEALLDQIARAVAPRVQVFRLESEVQGLRGQLEVLQAPSLPVLRAAEALAGTTHLGEALHLFAGEVRELVPHDLMRFYLRVSDDEMVELIPDQIRPLADLPLLPVASFGAQPVLDGERPWTLTHREEAEAIVVGLSVAGRVIGAMLLGGPHFENPRDAAAVAQQFATMVAPHLELLRRGTAIRPATAARRV